MATVKTLSSVTDLNKISQLGGSSKNPEEIVLAIEKASDMQSSAADIDGVVSTVKKDGDGTKWLDNKGLYTSPIQTDGLADKWLDNSGNYSLPFDDTGDGTKWLSNDGTYSSPIVTTGLGDKWLSDAGNYTTPYETTGDGLAWLSNNGTYTNPISDIDTLKIKNSNAEIGTGLLLENTVEKATRIFYDGTATTMKFEDGTSEYLFGKDDTTGMYMKSFTGTTENWWFGLYQENTAPTLGTNRNKMDLAIDSKDAIEFVSSSSGTIFKVRPYTGNYEDLYLGDTTFRWTRLYTEVATSVSSDERLKKDIVEIPDTLLEAWGRNVKWKSYNLKNGKGGRHFGLIAQDVIRAFNEAGLSWREYDIIQEDETEDKMLGVSYDEANAIENAYIRYKLSKL